MKALMNGMRRWEVVLWQVAGDLLSASPVADGHVDNASHDHQFEQASQD